MLSVLGEMRVLLNCAKLYDADGPLIKMATLTGT